VSDVTFDVTPGITGLARVSDGTVTIFDEPVRANPPLCRRLGVMSEHETVYEFLNCRDSRSRQESA